MGSAWRGVVGVEQSGEESGVRRVRMRERASELVALARWVPAHERELVLQVCDRGRSMRELARLMRVDPRTLRRRFNRIAGRMLSPSFACVVARRHTWPTGLRRVATACILHGQSVRGASKELGMSVHTVRRHRSAVLGMIDAQLCAWEEMRRAGLEGARVDPVELARRAELGELTGGGAGGGTGDTRGGSDGRTGGGEQKGAGGDAGLRGDDRVADGSAGKWGWSCGTHAGGSGDRVVRRQARAPSWRRG